MTEKGSTWNGAVEDVKDEIIPNVTFLRWQFYMATSVIPPLKCVTCVVRDCPKQQFINICLIYLGNAMMTLEFRLFN